jgi:hypothetical protein
MSNKNPFELRTDILAMAKDYMDQQYQINREFAQRAFDEAVAAQKVTADTWKTYVPEMYSIEDLMKKAQDLYGFVSKKD